MPADSASGKGLQASWFAGGLLLPLPTAMAVRGGRGEEGRKRRRTWGGISYKDMHSIPGAPFSRSHLNLKAPPPSTIQSQG